MAQQARDDSICRWVLGRPTGAFSLELGLGRLGCQRGFLTDVLVDAGAGSNSGHLLCVCQEQLNLLGAAVEAIDGPGMEAGNVGQ